MTTIYKYPLHNCVQNQIVTAPIIKPLKIDFQDEIPCLWAMVDTKKQAEEWIVFKIGTGWDLNTYGNASLFSENYLNTTLADDPYVWHWFCRKLILSEDM